MPPTEQKLDQPRVRLPEQKTESPGPYVRLGFLGVGWIGLKRLQAIADEPFVEVAAIADPQREARDAALTVSPAAVAVGRLDELLSVPLDGIVIATPSGQHADETRTALAAGVPVFCQKPLARTAAETRAVIDQARATNVLLAVDFCYRHIAGVDRLRQRVRQGALGRLFAIDLTFHNAYGPNKAWAYDIRRSGGGCVIDLATHLIDLAAWICGELPIHDVGSRLFQAGRLLPPGSEQIEDAAFAQWRFGDAICARLACSWNFSPGRDAQIETLFHGTQATAAVRNLDGSFYDFAVHWYHGARCEPVAGPPDTWDRRGLAQWARRLTVDPRFDADIERCCLTAQLIDSIYGR